MAARTDSRLPLGFDGPPSKGRCPHRPASPRVRGSPLTAHTYIHTVGADYISARNRVHRPPALRISHPVPDAPCAPLRYVRSTVVLLMSIPSGPMWASAPTMGAFSDGASNAAACMGGYKIRPYGPTPGFLVGAACMAARTDSRLPLGFDGPPSKGRCPHRPASPRVRGSPLTAHTYIHTVGADYISARNRVHRPPALRISHPVPDAPCAPLRNVRSAMVHPTLRCARAAI